MKILLKIMIGFIVMGMLTAAIGMASLSHLDRISMPLHTDIPASVDNIVKTSRLDSLAQFIRYYDEVLTQSARNYAFTGDRRWLDRYNSIVPELDQSIKTAINEGDAIDKEFFSQIDKANLALVDLEVTALSEVDKGNRQEAVKILESDEYWELKRVYEEGLRNYVTRRGKEYNEALTASTTTLDKATMRTQSLIQQSTDTVFVMIILIAILAVLSSIFFSYSIILPLNRLQKNISQYRENPNKFVTIQSKDEIGELAQTYNKMKADLKESRKNLEKSNEDLERQITQRTEELEKSKKELEAKLKDLEKLNKLSIGRELKMIELKKQLKDLESKK